MSQEAEPNSAIKEYVTNGGPEGWELAKTLSWSYWMYDRIRGMFFSPKDGDQSPLPQAVMSIDNLGVRTYAAYRLTFNPEGIPFNIILGKEWIKRSRWELAESIAHETVHLYIDWLAKKETGSLLTCSKVNHGKPFIDIAEQIGLHPVPGFGYHWREADGPFAKLMDLCCIGAPSKVGKEWPKEPPKDIKGSYWGDAPKGTSTLIAYLCEDCTKPKPCRIRAGKADLEIGCQTCSGTFKPVL